jgi:indolepyruvate ferredoxin oxidoreductase beta subunit
MGEPQEINVIICGVGGQGVILISEILGNAAVRDELAVTGSEVHGMAARGGSVSSHVRIGKEALAPTVPAGKCDILVAMEPAEALRNVSYLSPSSVVLLNTRIILPSTISLGKSTYPRLETIVEKLTMFSGQVIALDVFRIAEEAGSVLAANTAMIGALLGSGKLPVSVESVKGEIEARFGTKASRVNLEAFELGYQRCRASMGR